MLEEGVLYLISFVSLIFDNPATSFVIKLVWFYPTTGTEMASLCSTYCNVIVTHYRVFGNLPHNVF